MRLAAGLRPDPLGELERSPRPPSRNLVMVMVNVDLYSAIITKVSNALDTLVSGEKPGFQTLYEGLVVVLCAEVVRQRDG